MLYICLMLIAVLTLFPLFWGISASLRDDTELYAYVMPFTIHTLIPVEFTFKSYIELFTKYGFMKPVLNTVFVTGISIFFGCILNSVAAFAFAMFDFKFKKPIFTLVLLSFMIPFEAIALPLYQVADKMKMVDTYQGMILPSIASGLVLFLFVQFFKDIPADLLDAARVDGAHIGKIYTRILMPLSKPIFITAGLMIFMDQWNSYLWPLLIARSKEIRTIQIALTQFNTEHSTAWSALYAGSMFSALIPLLLFLPLQKYFVQGITSSGVKG
ncbi:carbohydrate ABC transporter permease [Blautia marasmi]|uniref:carbohydrate ABC transporter permease n=2 Tax=Blautia marasmi TaxID=1917868 RepID=UPI0025976E38|nr:carbohydrate ABC transporter permease [uncultured Blautia sp.]